MTDSPVSQPEPAGAESWVQVPPPAGSQRADGCLPVASLALGIVGILLVPVVGAGAFFGVPAVILGHVVRSRIRRAARGGVGMALAGLILGYLAIACSLLIWVLLGVVCSQAHGTGC